MAATWPKISADPQQSISSRSPKPYSQFLSGRPAIRLWVMDRAVLQIRSMDAKQFFPEYTGETRFPSETMDAGNPCKRTTSLIKTSTTVTALRGCLNPTK